MRTRRRSVGVAIPPGQRGTAFPPAPSTAPTRSRRAAPVRAGGANPHHTTPRPVQSPDGHDRSQEASPSGNTPVPQPSTAGSGWAQKESDNGVHGQEGGLLTRARWRAACWAGWRPASRTGPSSSMTVNSRVRNVALGTSSRRRPRLMVVYLHTPAFHKEPKSLDGRCWQRHCWGGLQGARTCVYAQHPTMHVQHMTRSNRGMAKKGRHCSRAHTPPGPFITSRPGQLR